MRDLVFKGGVLLVEGRSDDGCAILASSESMVSGEEVIGAGSEELESIFEEGRVIEGSSVLDAIVKGS